MGQKQNDKSKAKAIVLTVVRSGNWQTSLYLQSGKGNKKVSYIIIPSSCASLLNPHPTPLAQSQTRLPVLYTTYHKLSILQVILRRLKLRQSRPL